MSMNYERNQATRVPQGEGQNWGAVTLELVYVSPDEQMNFFFQKEYGVDYPKTSEELNHLCRNQVISGIEEARSFVIEKMSKMPEYNGSVDMLAEILLLERLLAHKAGKVCDLPGHHQDNV